MRSTRFTFALALSLTCASAAHAESKKPTAAAKERAQTHLRAGNVAFEKGDYEAAVTELKASYAELPEPSLLYALGQAYRMSGDCTHAVEAYRGFVESNPPEKQREAASMNIERCQETPAAALPAPAPTPAPAPQAAEPAPPSPPEQVAPTSVAEPVSVDSKAWYEDVPGDLLTGTGIAAAAVGTVLFLGGRSKVSDADAATDDGAFGRSRSDADSGLAQQRVGLAVMGVGGALIVGGVIRYLSVGGGSKETAMMRVAPTWGGVVAAGAF